jgi:hypothetical protein
MLESGLDIVDTKLFEVMRYPLLVKSSLSTSILMSIESNFATLNGLSCDIIQERSVALLEELSVNEAICAIKEFSNRYRWASHKIHRSISGYFRGVCKKYWKINREAHKEELKRKCFIGIANSARKVMIIDATVDLLFTKASGLSKELVDEPKRNMLLKFSSPDAIEALYEFCNAAMYREHKIRNMNAYLLNIIRRREALRESKGQGVPRRTRHRLDDNRLHICETSSKSSIGRRVRESLSCERSSFSRLEVTDKRGINQKKFLSKAVVRSPLPSPISIPSVVPRIKEKYTHTPQQNELISARGSLRYEEEVKNMEPETHVKCREGASIKGICLVKSKNPSPSASPRRKVNYSCEEKGFSVFCCKQPIRLSSLSPTTSTSTTESMCEEKTSEPLAAPSASPNSYSTVNDERPNKTSTENSIGDSTTNQIHTIHNLPILMDHYIISTLSEYIFSY